MKTGKSQNRRIGYARVSTSRQRIRRQIDCLKTAGCDKIYHDHGVSGGKASRPGLDRALTSLKPGDTIVVHKLCRLGRSVAHLSDLLQHFERTGIHFCSLTEGIDTTTAGGKLIFHVMSAIAEFQRSLTRELTLNGLEAAKARGKRLGRKPLLNDKQLQAARKAIIEHDLSTSKLATSLGVSARTLQRGLERLSKPVA